MERLTIECKEDNKFEYGRSIIHCCNSSFLLEKENVFYVETLGYGDEMVGQYYTICPNCGYIVLLDEIDLPNELRINAEEKNKIDPYLHKENDLISQLIHIRKKKTKARTIAFY